MKALEYSEKMKRRIKSQAIKQIEEALEKQTDSITISLDKYNKKEDKKKPTIYLTAKAYIEIATLVNKTSTEISWNGFVIRGKNKDYLVKEITVPPQKVTGSTTETDDDLYMEWFAELFTKNPEKADMLKYHGHSHVSMGVSPSGTDTGYRDKILEDMVNKDDFYLFSIHNKSGSMHWQIFDRKYNRFYDNDDITVEIIVHDNKTATMWYAEQEKMLQKPVAPVQVGYTNKTYYTRRKQESPPTKGPDGTLYADSWREGFRWDVDVQKFVKRPDIEDKKPTYLNYNWRENRWI